MKQRFPLNRRTERRAAARGRDNLVRRVRTRFMQTSWRLHLCVIITLAGVAAFLTSFVALRLGLSSMALRYPLAVAAGYLAFLVLIRGWIAWQRGSLDRLRDIAGDAVSNLDLSDGISPGSLATDGGLFSGGRSGGGGGGADWASAFSRGRSPGGSSRGIDIGLDLDELWPLLVVAACALGGLAALAYVISAAPTLLAEVALDAAIVSTLYRRLHKHDRSHWAIAVLGRTWVPALLLAMFAAVGGYALERATPDADSIGDVVRAVWGH